MLRRCALAFAFLLTFLVIPAAAQNFVAGEYEARGIVNRGAVGLQGNAIQGRFSLLGDGTVSEVSLFRIPTGVESAGTGSLLLGENRSVVGSFSTPEPAPIAVDGVAVNNDLLIMATESDDEFGLLFAVRESSGFTQSNLTGTWRFKGIVAPELPDTEGGWGFGVINVNGSGTITTGTLTTPSDVEVFNPGGTLTIGPSGNVSGTFSTGVGLDLDTIDVTGIMSPDKTLIVGTLHSSNLLDAANGLVILQKAPTVTFSQANLAGTYDVLGVSHDDLQANVGTWVRGNVTFTATGVVSGGTIFDRNDSFVPSGALAIDPQGFIAGDVTPLSGGELQVHAVMTADKKMIIGVASRFTQFEETFHSLFTLVRRPPPPPASSIQFTSTTGYSVVEGATATITVQRTGSTTTQVTVDYATNSGNATPAVDYTASTGTMTFAAGQTSRTFTIPITEDTDDEGNETVGLVLSNPTNGASLGGRATSVLKIVDNEATVQFEHGAYTVAESVGTAKLKVVRSGFLGGTQTVTYLTGNVTATQSADYTPVTGTLTFGPGVSSVFLNIPIINDTFVEDAESFTATIALGNGSAQLGANSSATITISDNDLGGTVKLSAASYTVAEPVTGNGVATITVLRTGGAAAGVTVDYATSDGAAGTNDFTAVSGTLTFAANETRKTFTIPILSDTLAEGTEAFDVILSNVTGGGTLGSPATGTVNITDNDAGGVLRFKAATLSVSEGAGSVLLTVTRSGGIASNVTIDYATGNGSATAGADYTAASGTLSFGAGNLSATFSVPIAQDELAEGNETFNVVLSNPTGGATLGAPATAAVTIVDDESSIQFSSPAFSVKEGVPTATVTVLRSGALLTTATVLYSTSPGNATPAVDYTAVSGTLTFTPGITTRTFTVPIVNDTLAEGTESLTLVLGNTSGGALLGTNATAVLDILDNDLGGVVRFQAANVDTPEKNGVVKVTVVRSLPTTGSLLAGAVTVDYATSDGSATDGQDYTNTSGTLTFNAGETTKFFFVSLVNDTLAEGAETLNVTLSNITGGASLGSPSAATVTIKDNDEDKGGRLQFSSPVYSVLEGAGFATITVTRIGGNASGVTIDYATGGGTAAGDGLDYTNTSGTLTFGAANTSATFVVPVSQDVLGEAPETINLALSNPTGGATLGTPSSAVLTIIDDESTLQFSTPSYTVNEGIATAIITVIRAGALVGTATVDYMTANQSALSGVDYLAAAGTLTFGPGVSSRTFSVRILNDTLAEGNETLGLELSNPTGGALLGANFTADLTIQDNDFGGTVSFSSPTYVVSETGVSALITVTRTGGTASDVTVDYTTSDGTAHAVDLGEDINNTTTIDGDYTGVSGTLTFGANVMSRTFVVPIYNDVLAEGVETIDLTLSNVTGNATLGTAAAVLSIRDNDVPSLVAFSAAAYVVNETGGAANITVTRAFNVASTVTVDYAATDGTASEELGDYEAAVGTLTFGPGETSKTFTVPINDDPEGEGHETVLLALTNPGFGVVLGRAAATLTISDDETTVQFTGNFVGNGLEVLRTGQMNTTVTVDYAAADGTAVSGSDYAPLSGTLTFGPGVARRVVPIVILADNLAEGPETFTVDLLNVSDNAQLGPNSSRLLTISDNDFGGAVQFGAASYSAVEGGNVSVTITRTGGTGAAFVVGYETQDGTAEGGYNYVAASGELTFAAGEMSKTITIETLNDDALGGPDTTFSINLIVAPGIAALGSPATTEITVIQADFGI